MVRRVAYYRQFERDNTRRIRYIPFAVINTSSLVQISNYLGFILCERLSYVRTYSNIANKSVGIFILKTNE